MKISQFIIKIYCLVNTHFSIRDNIILKVLGDENATRVRENNTRDENHFRNFKTPTLGDHSAALSLLSNLSRPRPIFANTRDALLSNARWLTSTVIQRHA